MFQMKFKDPTVASHYNPETVVVVVAAQVASAAEPAPNQRIYFKIAKRQATNRV